MKLYADHAACVVPLPSTLTMRSAASVLQRTGVVFRQPDDANMSPLVSIDVSTVSSPYWAEIDIQVDGNRGNNGEVTGVEIMRLKRGRSKATVAAVECDFGAHITGNVELAKFDLHVDRCGTGVLVNESSGATPDELLLNVVAHDCDTFFAASGSDKMKGLINFACEKSTSYGAKLEKGWWDVRGIIRSVGMYGDGGLQIDGAEVRGSLEITGGDDANCAWGANVLSGDLNGLSLKISGKYADEVFLAGGVAGSAQVHLAATPSNGTGIKLGDSAGLALDGFALLPGTEVNGMAALDLDNARSCKVFLTKIVGGVLIGAGSTNNTIHIPRKHAETVTFANSRTQLDNKILFAGSFTWAEMAALNGGAPFKGMQVVACAQFDQAMAFFDGTQWVPSYGAFASGEITVWSSSISCSVAHGLAADPGNMALPVVPDATGCWIASAATKYAFNVTAIDVVVFLDVDPMTDVKFVWQLHKVT
ncbi:hypothetical protein [Pelagimonas varians]|uniref:hypothetical protein n=1 Tax=Pelagimonas varians TaxID=696760 RepID=UPI0011416C78|nr:hypothetical protein [Pelagimonas varians]